MNFYNYFSPFKLDETNFRKLLIIGLILALVLPNFLLFGQEGNSQNSITSQQNLTPAEERQQLEEELKKLEELIAKYETDITKTQQEKKTLQNQISLLKKKIEKLALQIEQSNVMIKDVGIQISDTTKSINQTSLKIEKFQQQLISILRTVQEEDQKSLFEILLSEEELSGFFDNLVALETLDIKNQEILQDIKDLKSYLQTQKQSLDEEKTDLGRLLKIQTLQKQENESAKNEKDYFLKLTESQYQKYLKEKQETEKKATQIRARIFELIGVPQAPTFGEAYDIAKYVESITGVRPAFLLAVLTQESNIGKNVGQCFLKDPKTGSGVTVYSGKTVLNVMKPSRDIQPFLTITQGLGRDPYNTPVSCPIPSVGGYGGAMGPAQFIPSTWVLYRDRVKEITGKPADPWDIKDAFLAAALYLKDYGADSQNANNEWKAAMIYFSGSTNSRFRFYGDSVIALAKQYEEDIKAIEKGS